ncbi:hypothetical protein GQ44DRAFT_718904 [Phaeosphaeriaceae sp. PMI808]|nr:hypothetical protein GQ44DRAFT_718904 [Phaeosphaeriaceae sp. PMI808]
MAHEHLTSRKPFRVIVVGAGLVGLSISHGLQLANIAHVVLEKHSEIVSLHGAALIIYPGVARIFDQFGILKKIQDATTPMTREFQRWPDGSVLLEPQGLRMISEAFDMPAILIDRQKCIRHLYDNLPDQSKVRTSACVDRIEQTQTGVKAFLKDGTFEEGDIVIGADGVHSRVRQLMWDYAAEEATDTIPESDKNALFSEYRGLFGASEHVVFPDLGPSEINIVFGNDITKLIFAQPDVVYWALIYKNEYSRPPTRFKPDENEQEAVAYKLRNETLAGNLTFGDVWKTKTRSGLLNIEEGILDKWHVGRIVLVGDSAHKMTTDIGMGANMGIESAAVICNVLQQALASNPHSHPSTSEVSALFQEYQSKRHNRAKEFVELSGLVTRMRSWQSRWQRFLITRIAMIPMFQMTQAKQFIRRVGKSPKLKYAPTRTINEKAEGWEKSKNEHDTKAAWAAYVLLTSAMAVGLSYAVVLNLGMPVFWNNTTTRFLTSHKV